MMLGGRGVVAWTGAERAMTQEAIKRTRKEGMGIGQMGKERGDVVRSFLHDSWSGSRGIFGEVAVREFACLLNARSGEVG